ncbi:hypothetical protein [Thalassolituus marinus]|uniref:DUF5610 domain-containing protein n=1 Tax=Thalassolituus marinus TaxID=671053 RepID=A0ABS7ZSB9_9GAMM|nr:hypothetical protein [Thalassolituus marinus]MCA6063301.1 hypothetical protein [Thalassolituus marinus]
MDINNSSGGYQSLLSMLGLQSQADSSATTTTTSPSYGAVDYSDGDRVSVSLRAEKLSRISAEFFSGAINSSQIPALTERLYENGFLSADEFQMLGGQTQTVSAITEASNFLNRFILDESVDGDSDAARALLCVVAVIDGMDEPTTGVKRRQESDAYDYVANYTDLLKEAEAPADIIAGFENVLDVLSALDKVRKTEQSTGALASYASVQEAYDELYKNA